MNTKQLYP